MSFFSAEDWPQEVAALVVVALAVIWMVRRLRGPKKKAPPEQTPDAVQLGGRLARGLKKAARDRDCHS